MAQPPHSSNGESDANKDPFRSSDPNDMDIDEMNDFLDGSDADDFPSDFGSDYETVGDELTDITPCPTNQSPGTTNPPSTTATPATRSNNPFSGVTNLNPPPTITHSHPSKTNVQPDLGSPPSYSATQDDMNLALAISASLQSPAAGTTKGHPSNANPWNAHKSTGASTASVQAAQRLGERELAWQPPRAGVSHPLSEPDPPRYSAVASRGSAHHQKNMCVVCQIKPAFNNGYRSFPTCGNTCARLLEDAQKAAPQNGRLPSNSNHGHMGNPHRGGASSGRGAGAGGQGSRGPASSPIKMCQVCNLRPIYQKGGKIYPTCGLTCAAKMQAPGSVPLCDYCHERPRVVINNKIFPHCGRTCRDKAKAAGGSTNYYTTRATSATNGHFSSSPYSAPRKSVTDEAACTTCILCWANQRRSAQDDFCSDLCKDIAVQRGPILLEIPRGHVSFQSVEQYCIDKWKTKQSNYPTIKRIYMVQLHADFSTAYRGYQAHLSSGVGPSRTGNEVRTWISPSRQCSLGDAGCTTPCESASCMLCSLVRAPPRTTYSKGVLSMLDLERAVERASRMAKGRGNTLLLSQVLLGRSCDKAKNDLVGPLPTGYDSIRVVEQTMFGFGPNNYDGDNIVFDSRAIKPLYLISFD